METVRLQLRIQKANQLFKTYQDQKKEVKKRVHNKTIWHVQDKRYDMLVEAIQLYLSVVGSLPVEQKYALFSFFSFCKALQESKERRN
jgi:hypothetical protein